MIFFLNEDQVTLVHRSGDLRQSLALPSARVSFLPRRHEDTKGFFLRKIRKEGFALRAAGGFVGFVTLWDI